MDFDSYLFKIKLQKGLHAIKLFFGKQQYKENNYNP